MSTAARVIADRRNDRFLHVLFFLTVSSSGALLAGGCSADGKAFGGFDAGGTGAGSGSGGTSSGGTSGGAGSGGAPATGGSRGEGGISASGGRGEAGKGAGSGGHVGTGGSASGGGGPGGRTASGGSPGSGGGGAGGKSAGSGGAAGKPGAGGAGTAGAGGSGAGGQSVLTCEELVAEYAKALPAARACSPGAAGQCMQLAPTSLTYCTGCSSYVNDAKQLTAIRAEWTTQGCAVPTPCPAIACIAIIESCVATDGGAPGGMCQPGGLVAN